MSSIGDRLRKERDRLDMNQSDFASAAGTTRKTQFNYESDNRRPDADYLAAIAAIGADVLYILTGHRGKAAATAPPPLPEKHRKLIANYVKCTPDAQKTLMQMSELLAAGGKPVEDPAPGSASAVVKRSLLSGAFASINIKR